MAEHKKGLSAAKLSETSLPITKEVFLERNYEFPTSGGQTP
jgi:hypothetical protein